MLAQAHRYLRSEYPHCYPSIGVENRLGNGLDSGSGNRLSNGDDGGSSWFVLVFFVAHDTPSEIQIVRQMGCFDFMQLLNYKLKQMKL